MSRSLFIVEHLNTTLFYAVVCYCIKRVRNSPSPPSFLVLHEAHWGILDHQEHKIRKETPAYLRASLRSMETQANAETSYIEEE